ncbi:MAG: hypothetical protein JNL82_31285 [Myxococcales bacterium]|jgi:hypothetical protein|nr:hypothetical protein [Myxococcales bacterium]
MISRSALLALCLAAVACDGQTSTTPPTGSTGNGAFRISVMNACSQDLLIKVATSPTAGGRQQILNKNMRDTVTGTDERVYLMSNDEVVYTYEPIAGDQRATIPSDCTAIVRD